jgi:hypothetical protein
MTRTQWTRAAVVAWAALLLVVCARPLFRPTSATVYVTYATAGREFEAGRRLYDVMHPFTDNFRYSPLVAAGFVPFAHLPLGVGGALWRAIGAAIFLTGLAAWGRRVCPGVPLPLLFLGALPLAVGSLQNGQANTHVVGLMLWASVLAAGGRWAAAAALVAAAALFKGYPVAFGLLLALAAPLRCGLPLVAAIAAGVVLPYAFQSADYVTAQYRYWAENLGRDDRTSLPLYAGLQDAHMLLRVVGVHLTLAEYRLVQVLTGAAVAAVVVWQLRRGIDRARVALDAFTLGACWMATFGPVVESSTFILLAPVLGRELHDAAGRSRWARAAAYAGTGLFLLSVGVLAFPHHVHRPVVALGVQPLAALLVTAVAVGRVLHARPAQPAALAPAAPEPRRLAA